MRGRLFRKLPGFPGDRVGVAPSEEVPALGKRLWAGMRRASAGALKGPRTSGRTPQFIRVTARTANAQLENFHDDARGCGNHNNIDDLKSPIALMHGHQPIGMAVRLELSRGLAAASHEVQLFTFQVPIIPQTLADMTEVMELACLRYTLPAPQILPSCQADYARSSPVLSHSWPRAGILPPIPEATVFPGKVRTNPLKAKPKPDTGRLGSRRSRPALALGSWELGP